jgi:hypothetical protein
MTVADDVAALTDQQALSIVSSLAAKFASTEETPHDQADQAHLLGAVLAEHGQADVAQRLEAGDYPDAGAAARELLLLMAAQRDARLSLEEWLLEPPTQEAAALPLVLAAPVVLTGCIVLLQLIGHTRFERKSDGRWNVVYDPAKRAPLDSVITDIGKVFGRVAGEGDGA